MVDELSLESCPVCNFPIQLDLSNNLINIRCSRCGDFSVTGRAHTKIVRHFANNPDDTKISNFSGWIRENHNVTITTDDVERLVNLPTPSVDEKAQKLLKYLAKEYKIAGDNLRFNLGSLSGILNSIKHYKPIENRLGDENNLLAMLSSSWAQKESELHFLLHDYLINNRKYLYSASTSGGVFRITPEGWAYLEELKSKNPESNIAFIAMWFNSELNKLFDPYIKNAVLDSGYNPVRIDKHEHINRIDDEIIVLIKRSKFLIAEFTGQRGGVYFESGFALGLGLPVIWICKRSEIKEIHFDTNHYNFILWKENELGYFQKALQNRIEAVIDKGNYTQA